MRTRVAKPYDQLAFYLIRESTLPTGIPPNSTPSNDWADRILNQFKTKANGDAEPQQLNHGLMAKIVDLPGGLRGALISEVWRV